MLAFMIVQIPSSVELTQHDLVVHHSCWNHRVKVNDISNARIIELTSVGEAVKICFTPKFFWGMPTRLDKALEISTEGTCHNLLVSLSDADMGALSNDIFDTTLETVKLTGVDKDPDE